MQAWGDADEGRYKRLGRLGLAWSIEVPRNDGAVACSSQEKWSGQGSQDGLTASTRKMAKAWEVSELGLEWASQGIEGLSLIEIGFRLCSAV